MKGPILRAANEEAGLSIAERAIPIGSVLVIDNKVASKVPTACPLRITGGLFYTLRSLPVICTAELCCSIGFPGSDRREQDFPRTGGLFALPRSAARDCSGSGMHRSDGSVIKANPKLWREDIGR